MEINISNPLASAILQNASDRSLWTGIPDTEGKYKKYSRINSRKALDSALKSRPKVRTRTTGLVGPEPDWSIRYSDLDRNIVSDIFENRGRRVPGPSGYELWKRALFFPQITQSAGHFPMASHGKLGTAFMSDRDVLAWTQYAHEAGIQFHGARGYTRANSVCESSGYLSQASTLRLGGMLPCHKRSEISRIRRAALRGKRDCLIQSRPTDNLFVTRYRLSNKQIRQDYFQYRKSGGEHDLRAFRDLFVGKGITLFPPRCHGVVPNIVFKSLKRIYSKPTKVVQGKLWFKPTADLRYVLTVPSPPRKNPGNLVLKKGSIVRSFKSGVHASSILHSTIPRVDVDDPRFSTWDFTPTPLTGDSFHRLKDDFSTFQW